MDSRGLLSKGYARRVRYLVVLGADVGESGLQLETIRSLKTASRLAGCRARSTGDRVDATSTLQKDSKSQQR
jgi:hypothetical protein